MSDDPVATLRGQIIELEAVARQLSQAGLNSARAQLLLSRKRAELEDPPWIKALAEVRIRATREGWCHLHVQAIVVAIDQYAEAALGNRSYFLNKPYGIGDNRRDNIP